MLSAVSGSGSRAAFYRLVIALLLIVWLGSQLLAVANAGIADRYMQMASESAAQAAGEKDGKAKQQLLERSYQLTQKALSMGADHADYYLEVSQLLSRLSEFKTETGSRPQHDVETDAIIAPLRLALRDSPVRADVWARLAFISYEHEGASPATLQALNQALLYGPHEVNSLLISAMVTFYAWDDLNPALRQRGWQTIVEAMTVPELAGTIRGHAKKSGWDKQLQRLLSEKELEKRQKALQEKIPGKLR